MVTVIFTLAVATALSWAFQSTRWLGVIGVALLGLIYPLVLFGVLLIAGGVFYYFNIWKGD